MENIILVMPDSHWFGKRPNRIIPFAVPIISALLKDKYNFSIIDAHGASLSKEEILLELKAKAPLIVLVSGLSIEYCKQYHEVISLAKQSNPGCTTVLGGIYPTVLEKEVFEDKNIDYTFIGHAEERLVDFLQLVLADDKTELEQFQGIGYRNSSGKVVINPVKSSISDVKELVKPDYSMLDVTKYLDQNTKDWNVNSIHPTSIILTSFGCPCHCTFCATKTVTGQRIVFRPLQDILDEIDNFVNNYGAKHIIFFDDNILVNKKKHIYPLLSSIIDRKYNITWNAANVAAWYLDDELLELMKESGCTKIVISAESGSNRVLNEIIKKPLDLTIVPGIVRKCKELGIDILAQFVIGFPGETWDELRETFRFAEDCDFDLVHFHVATPLPKTELFEVCKKMNLLPSDFSFTNSNYFGFGKSFIKTDEFTPQEIMVLRAFEWDRINFSSPDKIKKAAKIYNMTLEELEEHRKITRANLGLHY